MKRKGKLHKGLGVSPSLGVRKGFIFATSNL